MGGRGGKEDGGAVNKRAAISCKGGPFVESPGQRDRLRTKLRIPSLTLFVLVRRFLRHHRGLLPDVGRWERVLAHSLLL